MKNKHKITAILLAVLCISVCGAWGAAYADEASAETRYVGGEPISAYALETIKYTSKTVVEDVTTANGAPAYFAVGSLPNGCGAVAGSVAVGFYDKYYANMIADWNSYLNSGRYKLQDNDYIVPVQQSLFSLMQTNVAGPGVSQSEFKDGLKSYINGQGYSVDYPSLGTYGSFDYASFKSAVSNNKVVVMFVKPSYYYDLGFGPSEDNVVNTYISGNHIMIAYGYYKVSYVLTDGTVRTDEYLKVITGLSDTMRYYKVGSYIDAACVVNVY